MASANSEEVLRDIKNKYEIYKGASGASGGVGQIEYALKKERGDYWRQKMKSITKDGEWSLLLKQIREELVVIKLPYGMPAAQTAAWNEYTVLMHLADRNDHLGKGHAKLLAANQNQLDKHRVAWLALEAVPTGLELAELTQAEDNFDSTTSLIHQSFWQLTPIEFICHLFLKLGRTLELLHRENIKHGDIKMENIMIGNIQEDEYPAIKLVDFGDSAILEDNELAKQTIDTQRFCKSIRILAELHASCVHDHNPTQSYVKKSPTEKMKNLFHKSPTSGRSSESSKGKGKEKVIDTEISHPLGSCLSHPQGWDIFVKTMIDGEQNTSTPSMAGLMRSFQAWAQSVVTNAPDNVKQYIGRVTNAAIEHQGYTHGISNAALKNAVKNYDP
ncbi:hypothetical protein K491DRAFT_677446 [Lophiostoma macrostomum CBS 122681]|uniref:Protein kinase domain-containing protein n=1 Tax=Lophiostoma macrostomum CBS 122681 TaxID=1314788 RepID=A0A6A6TCS5_9PLEO|nr:hypothetical protein K491DRAFT_677446 [Lophiostoma macrostomum CBS 122681]